MVDGTTERMKQRNHQVIRRWVRHSLIFTVIVIFYFTLIQSSFGQSAVYAEALGQANLRAQDFIESQKVGEILTGQRYPVIGRSRRYPWLLLGDAETGAPIGWVYQELVDTIGDLQGLPFSELNLAASVHASHETPTAPNPVGSPVMGTVQGEINLRAGPSITYPRLAVARKGETFEIMATHAQYPWLKLRVPNVSGGIAWVSEGLLVIEGDPDRLPQETQLSYATPELTPTAPVVRFAAEAENRSHELIRLGETIWQRLLEAGFDYQTEPAGAIHLYDLAGRNAIQFGEEIAFSGTSLTKVAILIELYRQLEAPPNQEIATLILNAIICSDNRATNDLLSIIGTGDAQVGALRVTETLQQLGMRKSFISAPYAIPGVETPQMARTMQTAADQMRNQPDPFNQATVDDLGNLMRGIYLCAKDDSGLLRDTFPRGISQQECQSMLHIMAENQVDGLLKSGVPQGIVVAHKHGWIADTHGNAAVFFTPGGDYILIMYLYKPVRLDFIEESLPLFAEVSRLVYHHFNPQEPMPVIRPSYIPPLSECSFVNSSLLSELQTGNSQFPP